MTFFPVLFHGSLFVVQFKWEQQGKNSHSLQRIAAIRDLIERLLGLLTEQNHRGHSLEDIFFWTELSNNTHQCTVAQLKPIIPLSLTNKAIKHFEHCAVEIVTLTESDAAL